MVVKDGMKPYVHQVVKPYDVMVYKKDGRVYAVDKYGKVIAKGEDGTDQTVFSYVFANAPPGSTIYIKRGTYSISSSLSPSNHGLCIYGESKIGGDHGTILQLTQSSIGIVLPSYCQLHRIAIDVNSKSCSNASAIIIGQNNSYIILDDIHIYGCGASTACVYIYGTGHTGGCIIQNSRFSNSYYPCIMVEGVTGGGVVNILNNVISCNYSSNQYGSGIYVGNSQNCVIKNNTINGTSKYGVYLGGSSNQNVINANVITNTVTAAIIEDGTSQNNIITDNIVTGSSITSAIGNSLILNNIGYVRPQEITNDLYIILDTLGSSKLLSPFTNISGTSITDYSRYSNTLTSATAVDTLYGYRNKATYYDLNGSSHYLYRTNDTDFDFGNATTDSAFSVVCCLNPDAVDTRFLIGKWDENNAREWRVFLDASGYPTVQLYDESADTYIGRQYTTSIGTGTWKVLVVTYDGSGISAGCKIYVDGAQVDNADYASGTYVAMEAVSAYLMVGAKKNGGSYSEYYDGKMTWIGVTGKELDADEVWSITQRLKGVLGV